MKSKKLLLAVSLALGCIAFTAHAQSFITLYNFTALEPATFPYFPYANDDGTGPQAGLLLSSNVLYGTARGGGIYGGGTVFAVNPDGSGFTTLHSFNDSFLSHLSPDTDGYSPEAGLVLSGNKLYGTTSPFGFGSGVAGTVFAVNTDGTGFKTLHAFTRPDPNTGANVDGAYPVAGLILSGATLYGTTSSGGPGGVGTVFAVNTDGTGFTALHGFTSPDPASGINPDGAAPHAGLILLGNTLYGTASNGGSAGAGTIFAVNTDGTGFTTLYSFTLPDPASGINPDGANPAAGLILSGNTLYGTASAGGSLASGTIFAINTDGSGFFTLHSFSASGSGLNGPSAGLVLSGNTLYGTTGAGGNSGIGTVFAVNSDGTGFATLYSFSGSDGSSPMAGLALSGNALYGTTSGGGANAEGTLFLLQVTPGVLAPVALNQSATACPNTPVSVSLGGSDLNTPPLPMTYSVKTGPRGGTLQLNGIPVLAPDALPGTFASGTGPSLTYTPNSGFSGQDTFEFTVNNGSADSAPAFVTIDVMAVPTAYSQFLTATEGTATTIVLNGSDPNSPPLPLTYTVTADPVNGVLSGSPPNLTYTPNPGYTGSDSFRFTVNNGCANSSPAIVTISVVIGAPTAYSQSVTVTENETTAVILNGSDPNYPPLPLTYTVTQNPFNGLLGGTPPNLTYTPNTGYTGPDSFQFTVNNGTVWSSPGTVSINVVAIAAPAAYDQSLGTAENTPRGLTLTGSDPNTPPLPLTYAVTEPPANGVLGGTPPNLSYTPNPGYTGRDSFQFIVNNGILNSAPATVSITTVSTNGRIVVNFDSVDTSGGQVDATAYLASFGIGLTDVYPLGSLQIVNQKEFCCYYVFASSPPNVLDGGYGVATDVSYYTLVFPTPMQSVSFTRCAYGYVATPPWTATAYAGSQAVDSVGVCCINSELFAPAQSYTLTSPANGPGITSLKIWADGYHFCGINSPPLDDFVLVPALPASAAPTAYGQFLDVPENTATIFALKGTDPNSPPLPLTYRITSAPANGTLSTNGNTISIGDTFGPYPSGAGPTLTYTPDTCYKGPDGFQFVVNNGSSDSLPATVSVTVMLVRPQATSQSVATLENMPTPVTLSGRDANGLVLAYKVTANPTQGALAGIPPDLIYTPNTGFVGEDSFQFTVNNGCSDSLATNVSINIVGTGQNLVASATVPVGLTAGVVVPPVAGQGGVTATLDNTPGSQPVAVKAQSYAGNPEPGSFGGIGTTFVDLQVSGASTADTMTAYFYYPSSVSAPSLKYYTGAGWENVLSSGGQPPVLDQTPNLDGTVSGGRFTVLFDSTSTPPLTALNGTVFALATKATPVITWVNPADIVYPSALGGLQLNATANVPGSLTYAPSAGTVLNAGAGQRLSVSFTPSDTADYTTATASVAINVLKGTPVIAWVKPADILYGTALGAAQLDATANVPGSFTYTPVAGAVLNAGAGQTLSVSFAPADTADYTPNSASVTLDVLKASLNVRADNAQRVYGSPNPAFTGVITGIQNNDAITAMYTSTATLGSLAGQYPIVPTLVDLNQRLGNYTVSVFNGTLTVTPAPLTVTIFLPPSGLLQLVDMPFDFLGVFTKSGTGNAYPAGWSFNTATLPDTNIPAALISGTITNGTLSNSIAFPVPGVYLTTLSVTDAVNTVAVATNVGNALPAYVVVYNPKAGSATGGGWLESPPGALAANPTATGKATFGFEAQYQGADDGAGKAPRLQGEVEFELHGQDFQFRSTSLGWLVIANGRAQLKGKGQLGHQGDYGFLLTAVELKVEGSKEDAQRKLAGLDRGHFRLSIWDSQTGQIIYDNQMGAGINAPIGPPTALSGGSIQIHLDHPDK